ncbi:hypothetical protein E4U19_002178 [Claviceps sp. Clav32 group G5]|nr:hypothetical protein E4U19_002178 [Claviceps sp. Clav32 group G5]KAG6047218.1 hypothetical protein E4U39_000670 [Claviceps sp. Clav50 group G5]
MTGEACGVEDDGSMGGQIRQHETGMHRWRNRGIETSEGAEEKAVGCRPNDRLPGQTWAERRINDNIHEGYIA